MLLVMEASIRLLARIGARTKARGWIFGSLSMLHFLPHARPIVSTLARLKSTVFVTEIKLPDR